MSRENVEIMERGFAHFQRTGALLEGIVAPDFVWDMSKFTGWPESPRYTGTDGARRFLEEWTEPFEDWRLDVESFRDAGDEVVVVLRQLGRSKLTGMPVDMRFAQVWTIRDGRQTGVVLYATPEEAFRAAGLEE